MALHVLSQGETTRRSSEFPPAPERSRGTKKKHVGSTQPLFDQEKFPTIPLTRFTWFLSQADDACSTRSPAVSSHVLWLKRPARYEKCRGLCRGMDSAVTLCQSLRPSNETDRRPFQEGPIPTPNIFDTSHPLRAHLGAIARTTSQRRNGRECAERGLAHASPRRPVKKVPGHVVVLDKKRAHPSPPGFPSSSLRFFTPPRCLLKPELENERISLSKWKPLVVSIGGLHN